MCRHKTCLILVLLLISFCLSAQDIYRVTASSSLNVRKQPSTNSVVVGRLLSNEEVVVLNKDSEWAEIIWKDDLAYASSKYLAYQSPVPQSDTLYMVAYEVVNADGPVSVRSEPSLSSKVIASVTRGMILKPVRALNGWIEVSLSGETGYVNSFNLKRVLYKEIVRDEPVAYSDPASDSDFGSASASDSLSCDAVRDSVPPLFASLPSSIVSVPRLASEKYDLYVSARVGLGGSSYSWDDGPVSGKVSFALDALTQFYVNEKISIIPKGYYAEGAIGYALKGASSLPMHYLDLHLMPIGYYHGYKELRFLGKLGVYTGFPLSDLRYVKTSNVDFGISCGAAVEYRLLSAGLTFDRGFVKVAPSSVELYNWGIMFQITCKIVSFNR